MFPMFPIFLELLSFLENRKSRVERQGRQMFYESGLFNHNQRPCGIWFETRFKPKEPWFVSWLQAQRATGRIMQRSATAGRAAGCSQQSERASCTRPTWSARCACVASPQEVLDNADKGGCWRCSSTAERTTCSCRSWGRCCATRRGNKLPTEEDVEEAVTMEMHDEVAEWASSAYISSNLPVLMWRLSPSSSRIQEWHMTSSMTDDALYS